MREKAEVPPGQVIECGFCRSEVKSSALVCRFCGAQRVLRARSWVVIPLGIMTLLVIYSLATMFMKVGLWTGNMLLGLVVLIPGLLVLIAVIRKVIYWRAEEVWMR